MGMMNINSPTDARLPCSVPRIARNLGENISSSGVKHDAPLGFSRQFETHLSHSNKVFYVEGCWQYCRGAIKMAVTGEVFKREKSGLPFISPAWGEAWLSLLPFLNTCGQARRRGSLTSKLLDYGKSSNHILRKGNELKNHDWVKARRLSLPRTRRSGSLSRVRRPPPKKTGPVERKQELRKRSGLYAGDRTLLLSVLRPIVGMINPKRLFPIQLFTKRVARDKIARVIVHQATRLLLLQLCEGGSRDQNRRVSRLGQKLDKNSLRSVDKREYSTGRTSAPRDLVMVMGRNGNHTSTCLTIAFHRVSFTRSQGSES